MLTHEFVEYIPDDLQVGTVYVSVAYATAAHTCCCGCGNKVITPLSPTDWQLTFDGETISLTPSIGNWSFACRSHYWITRNRVRWASRWTDARIAAGRAHDRLAKERHFDRTRRAPGDGDEVRADTSDERIPEWQPLRWLKKWWSGRHWP